MGKVIEALLQIGLKDNLTKPLRSVVQALADTEHNVKSVSKAMAGTGASDKFVASLSKLKLAKTDVESVAKALKDYAASAGLAADASQWTKRQAADFRAMERQVHSSVSNMRREQEAYFKSQKTAPPAGPGFIRRMGTTFVQNAGGMIAGGGIIHGAMDAIKGGAEIEQLKFRVSELSRNNPGEKDFAASLAAAVAARYPMITQEKALDTYLELRANAAGAGGRIDEGVARRNLMVAGRAQTAAAALGFEMTPVDMQNLLKSVEGSGRASDPKAVEKITDAYIRAKQVFGTAIASSMVRDYVANAKSANFSIGDDAFYLQNMVRMTEGNASRLGNEVNQTMSTLVGGSMKKATGMWLQGLGLVNANQIVPTGGGNVKIVGGVKNAAQLQTDQMGWAHGTLLPAIEASGALSEEKVQARMNMLADQERKRNPNATFDERFLRERAEEGLISSNLAGSGARTTVTDNLAHMIANFRLIERDIEQLQNASGADAADRVGQNPIAALKELGSAIADFAAAVGNPGMKAVGPVLDGIAHFVAGITATAREFSQSNPEVAKYLSGGAIAVGMGGGLWMLGKALGGFGLSASATALDGSAAALTAAAVKLGGGLPGGIPGPGGGWFAAAGLAGGVASLATWLGLNIGEGLPNPLGWKSAEERKAFNDRINASPSLTPGVTVGDLQQQNRDRVAKAFEAWFGPRTAWVPDNGAPTYWPSAAPAVAGKANEAKAALDGLNATVAPNVDVSALDLAIGKARELLAVLGAVGPAAANAGAATGAVARGPASFPTYRSMSGAGFTTTGVRGQ